MLKRFLAALVLIAGLPLAVPAPTVAVNASTPFSDGFESGSLSAWAEVRVAGWGQAGVESTRARTGTQAARLASKASGGSYGYARASLGATLPEVVASGDFYMEAEGVVGGSVPLLRLYDRAGLRLVNLYRQNGTSNRLWVQHSGAYHATNGTMPLGRWAHVDLHVIAAGTAVSTVEVRVDGALVYATTSASLGQAGTATVQIGNDSPNQAFVLFADNIVAYQPGSFRRTPRSPQARAEQSP